MGSAILGRYVVGICRLVQPTFNILYLLMPFFIPPFRVTGLGLPYIQTPFMNRLLTRSWYFISMVYITETVHYSTPTY